MMGASNLFGDLQTDEEKASFFLRGDGYASGIIAKSIQADVALAYQRCVSFKHENAAQRATIQQLEALVKELEDRLFRHKEMDNPPCFCCGYNGPLYYQPSVHACAARHHKCNQDNP